MERSFTLGLDLASRLESAMNQGGGWDADLVKAMCKKRNLALILAFLSGKISRDKFAPRAVNMRIVAISPKARVRIPNVKNRSYTHKRPATLTTVQVRELLSHFTGEELEALRTLIVEGKNEPCRLDFDSTNEEEHKRCKIMWHFFIESKIFFKKLRVDGMEFLVVVNYLIRGQGRREFQLWEIERPVAAS